MYEIRLNNCAFFAHHGVREEEAKLGQRFYVDAVLHIKPAPDALSEDRVESTVNYGHAFAEIERVVTGSRRKLIETLAQDIAQALCERFAYVRRAEIAVRKPSAPVSGILDHVEVRVVHDAAR